MIVPSSGILQAVRPRFEDFSHLLPVSKDPAVVYRAGDKIEAYRAYQRAPASMRLLDHHPATIVAARDHRPTPEEFARLSLPVYVKSSSRDADQPVDGDTVQRFWSSAEAYDAVAALLDGPYRRVLIQEGVEGIQVCVGVLMGREGPLAVNCVRDSHPQPHSNGTMSLRHSWWHQSIVDDAIARLQALEWLGCAMVEYRWVPQTDAFNVIEINARFWQYLHLDLHAGVDFPRLMAEWFFEGSVGETPTPRQGVVCRDAFPGEVAQLVNALRDGSRSLGSKAASVAAFCASLADPRIHADLSFPKDRMIYFRELLRFFLSELRLR